MAKPVSAPERCSNKPLLEKLGMRIQRLHDKFIVKQKAGKDTTCSEQIYKELSGLFKDTCDVTAIKNRLKFFEDSLKATSEAQGAARNQSIDGAWGLCVENWYWKVSQSIDYYLDLLGKGDPPQYKLSFLDRINSPEELKCYFDSIKMTNRTKPNYVDHRRELNEGGTTLVRFVLMGIPEGTYKFHSLPSG